jgi:hypothetical protein
MNNHLDAALESLYNIRKECLGIIRELKAIQSHQIPTPRLGEQEPDKKG